MTEDIFNDENEVKPSWIKWGVIGDHIVGILTRVSEQESRLPGKEGEMQKIYEIKANKGEFHNIIDGKVDEKPTTINTGEYWNVGGKIGLDFQMLRVKLGQKIGLKFVNEKPAKTKGYSPSKLIKLYTKGEIDETFLAEQDLI